MGDAIAEPDTATAESSIGCCRGSATAGQPGVPRGSRPSSDTTDTRCLVGVVAACTNNPLPRPRGNAPSGGDGAASMFAACIRRLMAVTLSHQAVASWSRRSNSGDGDVGRAVMGVGTGQGTKPCRPARFPQSRTCPSGRRRNTRRS